MDLKQAIKILEAHNRWRRGEDVEPMVEPNDIGIAIDIVVEYVKNNGVLDDVIKCGDCGSDDIYKGYKDNMCNNCQNFF